MLAFLQFVRVSLSQLIRPAAERGSSLSKSLFSEILSVFMPFFSSVWCVLMLNIQPPLASLQCFTLLLQTRSLIALQSFSSLIPHRLSLSFHFLCYPLGLSLFLLHLFLARLYLLCFTVWSLDVPTWLQWCSENTLLLDLPQIGLNNLREQSNCDLSHSCNIGQKNCSAFLWLAVCCVME